MKLEEHLFLFLWVRWSLYVSYQVEHFTGTLCPQIPKYQLNALLLGPSGSAKSSFINSSFSLVSSSIQHNISSLVTDKIMSYRLVSIESPQHPSCLRLWDSWPVTTDNYTSSFFVDLLMGRVPLRTVSESSYLPIPEPKNRINIVVFFFPPEVDSEVLANMTRLYSLSKNCK